LEVVGGSVEIVEGIELASDLQLVVLKKNILILEALLFILRALLLIGNVLLNFNKAHFKYRPDIDIKQLLRKKVF
jgi:hypothetical protein